MSGRESDSQTFVRGWEQSWEDESGHTKFAYINLEKAGASRSRIRI